MEEDLKAEQPHAEYKQPPPPTYSTERFSLPPPLRITYGILAASFAGMFLGLSHGSKLAGMRFRAENAHRFPTTQKGWYLYHKSKNYHAMLGGLKDGGKMAVKLSFWAGSFFCAEIAVDNARGGVKDFASTTIAGLGVAGAFSAWNRFPLTTTVRTVKIGMYGGLAFGLAQDFVTYLKGGRLRYVDFVLGRKHDFQTTKEAATLLPSTKTDPSLTLARSFAGHNI